MQKTPLKALVVAGVLILFIASLAVMLRAGSELGETLAGPNKLTRAPDGTVWAVSHQRLHQFKNNGARLRTIELSDLHIDQPISGIAFANAETMFLAQAAPSRLFRCNLTRRTCTDLTPTIAKTAGPTTHALMLAAEGSTRRLLVSDNGGHRLLLIDFDGNVLDVSPPGAFLFPNQPLWLSPDEVAIPDTNHHRIVTMRVKDDKLTNLHAEFLAIGELGRHGRTWPMDVQRAPDGTWWVLNAQNRMSNADLVQFGPSGKMLARVDLGEQSDPTAIAIDGNELLVAEPTRAALLHVPLTGANLHPQPFGDDAFQGELARLDRQHTLWTRIRIGAQIIAILVPLLGVFLLWRMGEPLTSSRTPLRRPENVTPLPVHDHQWLTVTPAFRRRQRWLLGGHLLLVLIVIAAIHWGFVGTLPTSGAQSIRTIVLLFDIIMAGVIVIDIVMIVRLPTSARLRLGTDGENLLLDRAGDGSAGIERYPLASVATDGRQLLAGRHLIQLATPFGARFDKAALDGYLLSRMPPSAFVSPLEFIRQALQNGNRIMWVLVILTLAFVSAQVAALLFPALAAAWKAKLAHTLAAIMRGA